MHVHKSILTINYIIRFIAQNAANTTSEWLDNYMNKPTTEEDLRACAPDRTWRTLPKRIDTFAQLQLTIRHNHGRARPVSMIINTHGHIKRLGWSKMPHQVVSNTLEISGTVSPLFAFCKWRRNCTCRVTVSTTYIFEKSASCSFSPH